MTAPHMQSHDCPHMQARLRELATLFLRLGTTAFGGPAAHIAMMRDEVVLRRQWLSDADFLDLLGATNLIPGPNSTEMAIHLGHRRAGWPGLVVAGTCFILPAALITLALAWLYVRFASRPDAAWLLYGVKPVVIAIVAQAVLGLAPVAARTVALRLLAIAVAAAAVLGVNEFLLLLLAGLAAVAIARSSREHGAGIAPGLLPASAASLAGAGAATAGPAMLAGVAPVAPSAVGIAPLFWVFAKIGSVLFGSGYVLLAFLRAELVERLGWLTPAQLVDAIAIGQLTPGPVFTTATFVGYVLAGNAGACAATLGIFLPAFVFVALSAPLLPRLRRSWVAGALLDGVNVASLALMAVVTLQLVWTAVVDVPTGLLALASTAALVRWKV
ncbi:chromate efflux transporter, partial [Candidatus Binatia bacterium]|nr:chromate efflux transporter [Candidatus Binatia bacterium]